MFCCCKKKCDAKIVNNALIASFFEADQPKVWRADLSQVSSAAFEVREAAGKFRLTMQGAAGSAEEIAVFSDKPRAVAALQSITRALMAGGNTGSGTVAPAGGGVVAAGASLLRKILKFVLWIVGIFIFLVLVLAVFGPPAAPSNDAPVPQAGTGVQVPLEEMLGK